MRTPAQPCFTACDVSLTVSVIEQQPVPGIMRDVSTPVATSSSSRVERSSAASEFASLVVPNTASPQFCESSHWQCAMKRSLSGEKSAPKGVTTGARTPRIRLVMTFSESDECRRRSCYSQSSILHPRFLLLCAPPVFNGKPEVGGLRFPTRHIPLAFPNSSWRFAKSALQFEN